MTRMIHAYCDYEPSTGEWVDVFVPPSAHPEVLNAIDQARYQTDRVWGSRIVREAIQRDEIRRLGT